MRKSTPLFLHVGHVKTGSSFLQSALASSRAGLSQSGLIYPDSAATEAARRGQITSGNFRFAEIVASASRWQSMVSGDQTGLVFSNEHMIDDILADGRALDTLYNAGFALQILLFTRDPLELIVSAYSQAVKRGGYSGTMDDYVRRHGLDHPILERVGRFLRLCRDAQVPVTLRNYSRHRRDLLSCLADFLSIDAASLVVPAAGVVNRSLTQGELVLQRRLNEVLDKKAASAFADALCIRSPEVRDAGPFPSAQVLEPLVANLNRGIQLANQEIAEEAERYEPLDLELLKARAGKDDLPLTFEPQQLQILAEVMAGMVSRGHRSATMKVPTAQEAKALFGRLFGTRRR